MLPKILIFLLLSHLSSFLQASSQINRFQREYKTLSKNNGDHNVYIWNVTNGKLKYSLQGHTSNVMSLAALDHGLLASGSTDSTIKIWSLSTGKLKYNLTDCDTSLGYFLLVKLEKNLLASASDNGITIWNISNGTKMFSLFKNKVLVIDMVKLGETFLVASSFDSNGYRTSIWNVFTGEFIKDIDSNEMNYLLVPLNDNQLLASVGTLNGKDIFIKVMNISSNTLKYRFKNASPYSLTQVGQSLLANQYISADGTQIGPVNVWDLNTGTLAFNLSCESTLVLEICEIQGADLIQTKSLDNTTRIWSLKTGELIYTLNELTYSDRTQIILYPPMIQSLLSLGNNLTASGSISNIRIWDVTTGKLKLTLQQDTTDLWSLVKLNDGLLASANGFFLIYF